MTQQPPIQTQSIDLLGLNPAQKRNIKNVLGTLIKDSYPASVVWAKAHRNICKYGRNASKIKEKKGTGNIEDVPICPCCSNQIIAQPFPLNYNTSLPSRIEQGQQKFGLSSGICLFFMFVKMCIYYLTLRFIVCDGYNIISSMTGHYCSQNQDKCSDFFESVLAGYNKHSFKDEGKLDIIDILNCVLVFLSIAFFTYYRRLFDRVHVFLDEVNITEDDYSLLVQNIPSIIRSKEHHNHEPFEERDFNVSIEDHLNDMFLQKFSQELAKSSREDKENYLKILRQAETKEINSEQIVNIALCYDLSEFQNINKIERLIFDQLAQDELSRNEFQNLYLQDFEETKQKIKKEIKSDLFLSSRQKKDLVEKKIFEIEADKISSIFIDNFRYRIKREGLSERDLASKDINIRKYLVFLSKIDQLSAKARKKYVNKDGRQTYHSFFIGKAFVTFQHQYVKHKLLQRYEKNPTDFKINNKVLVISQPTEPEDILWQNLKVTNQQRAQSVFLSMLILFMCIGFSFIFTLIAQETQIKVTNQLLQQIKQENNLQRHFDEEPATSPQMVPTLNSGLSIKVGTELIQGKNLSNIFNTLMIVLTNVVNILLEVIIRKITDLERHKSKTDKIEAMINRFVISKFLNTCIIYFILYIVNKDVDILSQNGLTNKILKLVSIGAVIDIMLNVTLPGKSIKQLYYSFLYRNISYVNTTQSKLNEQLSYPQFDFVERYSYYIVQLYLVSFYSYLCPIAVPLVLCVFVVQYWIDKINLFKRCSANNQMGFQLSLTTLKLCKSSLLVFAVGNIIFYQVINVYQQFTFTVLNTFTFFVCLAYIFYVYRCPKFIYDWLQESMTLNTNIPYDQYYRNNFISSTYWSQNPATCKSSKHRDAPTDQIKIHDDPLDDGMRLTYMANQTIDQLCKIFLPYQLKRYFRWEQKYEAMPETYEKSDIDLFNRCFKLQ